MPDLDTSLGLPAARAMDPAGFVIAGRPPRVAVRPADRGEVVQALSAAGRDRLSVIPWGAGAALGAESAPERYDVALDLAALDRIVEYNPEDFTLTAECGVTLEALRATLAARGQELPLEGAGQATLGGVLASDASGARRLRFGAPHDRILGARFVLADGTLARSGGKVVKNVAGYALHRLLCGSHGALAVIVEASLKLAPAPATRVALIYHLDLGVIADSARWSWLPRLEPSFATVVGAELARSLLPGSEAGGAFTAIVGLEDDATRVAEQEAVLTQVLGAPRSRLAGDEAATITQSLADLEEYASARLTFTTSGNTPPALVSLRRGEVGGRLLFHAPAGRLHAFPASQEAEAFVTLASGAGFTLRSVRGIRDVSGPPPQAGVLALRARIRAALDPAGTFARGERWAAGAL